MDPIAVDMAALQAEMVLLRAKTKSKAGSRWWRFLGKMYHWITLGKVPEDLVMRYATTSARTIYLPIGWDQRSEVDKLELLTHEVHHIKQWDKWWVLMSIWWCLPFPIGIAYGRYTIERAAYVEGYKVSIKYDPGSRQVCIDHGVQQMTGPEYFWTWPFKKSVRAWFEAHVPRA